MFQSIDLFWQYYVIVGEKVFVKFYGVIVLEYDGIVEVWFDSFDDWKVIVSDIGFVENVVSK